MTVKFCRISKSDLHSICDKLDISQVDLLLPAVSDGQKLIITVINSKLKDCGIKELKSINTMIDIIRSTYRHK